MNNSLKKVLAVFLAIVAIFSVMTTRAFAANPAENRGVSHESTARADDHGQDPTRTPTAEDFSFSGIIEAINGNVFTIGGQSVVVNALTQLDSGLTVGSTVKAEVVRQADGSLLAKEIETGSENENETEHLNGDDHGRDANEIDDHGRDTNTIDDHGKDTNTIDDHGKDTGKVDDRGGKRHNP